MDKEQQARLDRANKAPIVKDKINYDSYDYFYKINRDNGASDIQAHEMAMSDCEALQWD